MGWSCSEIALLSLRFDVRSWKSNEESSNRRKFHSAGSCGLGRETIFFSFENKLQVRTRIVSNLLMLTCRFCKRLIVHSCSSWKVHRLKDVFTCWTWSWGCHSWSSPFPAFTLTPSPKPRTPGSWTWRSARWCRGLTSPRYHPRHPRPPPPRLRTGHRKVSITSLRKTKNSCSTF